MPARLTALTMCGIAGIWNRDGRPLERAALLRFTRALAHRGPDGEGLHVDGALGLGHRRLAVLDPSSAGDQPMAYRDGELWATFNGEIYNFLELRAELEGRGHRFRSRCDTEVLLAAYAEWGEACQLRFNGMWAFAIWDRREQRLFLSRDRFGVKPLLYVHEADRFAFASELKAFLALDDFAAAFDPQAVANKLHQLPMLEAADETLLRGVHKLGAGHCLRLRRGEAPRLHRWWHTLEHLEAAPPRYADQVEAFRARFLDACRLRTRSDRRLGTTLSGGLDSSSIFCALTRLGAAGGRERAVQIAVHAQFPDGAADETSYARAAAAQAEAALHLVPLRGADLLAVLDDVLFAFEGIAALPSVRWFTYRELRRLDAAVTIDGDGGDELLAGYAPHFEDAVRASLAPVPRLARAAAYYDARHGPADGTGWQRWRGLAALIGRGYRDILLREVPALQSLSRTARARAGRAAWLRLAPDPPAVAALHQDRAVLAALGPLDRELYADFHYVSLPGILRSVDRASMAHGVEVRSPFLDWRLVCLAFSLPEASKLGAGHTKRVLRSAMRGILPAAIEQRADKIPFQPPLLAWLDGPLRQRLRDGAASRDFLQSSIWDGPRIRADLEAGLERQDPSVAAAAAPFVHAARLMQLFKDRAGADREPQS